MATNIRKLEVTDTKFLGANMKRITLHGDDLSDFPENQESGYVKIRFPKPLEDLNENTKKTSIFDPIQSDFLIPKS